jgi:alanine racemase
MLEVDLKSIRHNYKTLIEKYSHDRVCIVLKANGYGFGLESILCCFATPAPKYAAVLNCSEAKRVLKDLPTTQIQLLDPFEASVVREIVDLGLEPMVENLQQVKLLEIHASRYRACIGVHVKIDTGLGRFGCDLSTLRDIVSYLKHSESVRMIGIYSHGAPTARLDGMSPSCLRSNFDLPRHCRVSIAHTSLTAEYMADQYDTIRFGVAPFGLLRGHYDDVLFTPTLRLSAKVLRVRHLKKGAQFGYHEASTCRNDSTCMVLNIGYANGLSYRDSNNLFVRVGDHRFNLIAPPLMNHTFALGPAGIKIKEGVTVYVTSECERGDCLCGNCPVKHSTEPPKVAASRLLTYARLKMALERDVNAISYLS